ncbi:MAG: hypothetical protein HY057_07800 [Rhodospirillales bacterium]|nr:hypothetical protein [Rhodospirillales bacterium]
MSGGGVFMVNGFSPLFWTMTAGMFVLVLLISVPIVWMVVRVLHKAGYSGWWAVFAVLAVFSHIMAVVFVILLWVFAFAEWPHLRPAAQTLPPPQA